MLARDPEGYASIVRRQSGKGQVLMIGTLFFQAYFAGKSGKEAADFLGKQLKIGKKYRLTNPDEALTFRVLEGDGSDVLIIINHADERTAELDVPGGKYDDLLTGESYENPCSLPLAGGPVRVLKHDK